MNVQKRILFVGAAAELARELKERFGNGQGPWQVGFARGFLEAMALMTATPCDAVVADLLLPGFSGAQLLSEVMQRHPRSLRFLCADPRRLPASPKSAAAAHQVILKPVTVASLVAILEQALQRDTWFPGEQAQRLLSRMPTLPPPPEVYFQIFLGQHKSGFSWNEIAELLATHPEVRERLLRLVPASPQAEGRRGKAAPLPDLASTAALSLLAHVLAYFDGNHPREFELDPWERQSLLVAQLARRIAVGEAPGSEAPAQAFTAGLMHDLGSLLLAANVPERHAGTRRWARQKDISLWQAEQDVLGTTHAEIGACLLSQWGLPWPVVEAVALHHLPGRLSHQGFSPHLAVHAAAAFVADTVDASGATHPDNITSELLGRTEQAAKLEHWRLLCREELHRSALEAA